LQVDTWAECDGLVGRDTAAEENVASACHVASRALPGSARRAEPFVVEPFDIASPPPSTSEAIRLVRDVSRARFAHRVDRPQPRGPRFVACALLQSSRQCTS
jgi:hypothetical protein